MNNLAFSPGTQADNAEAREVQWPLQHITLAGLKWGPEESKTDSGKLPVIMLHGWLDNSQTFCRIAPELARTFSLHAVDFAGHGHSGHRPPGQGYQLTDYVADLAELVELHFGGEDHAGQVDIVGHSLGGIVGTLYAATFPERVRKLVMIDSIGAMSRPASETVSQLRKALKKRMAGSGRPAVYSDVASAAKVREGGLSPLSHEAALALMPRNLKPEGKGYSWRTDARLRHPSPLIMTEEQVLASLKSVEAQTLFLRAQEGLLAKREGIDTRLAAVPQLQVLDMPGGHHCHLDGDTQPVANAVRHFLESE